MLEDRELLSQCKAFSQQFQPRPEPRPGQSNHPGQNEVNHSTRIVGSLRSDKINDFLEVPEDPPNQALPSIDEGHRYGWASAGARWAAAPGESSRTSAKSNKNAMCRFMVRRKSSSNLRASATPLSSWLLQSHTIQTKEILRPSGGRVRSPHFDAKRELAVVRGEHAKRESRGRTDGIRAAVKGRGHLLAVDAKAQRGVVRGLRPSQNARTVRLRVTASAGMR